MKSPVSTSHHGFGAAAAVVAFAVLAVPVGSLDPATLLAALAGATLSGGFLGSYVRPPRRRAAERPVPVSVIAAAPAPRAAREITLAPTVVARAA